MNKKALTEADIRTKFITPALVGANGEKWNVMTQIREEAYFTKGRVIVRGKTVERGEAKKADYLLSYKPNLPLAVVEAKDNNHSVGAGMQQALEQAEILDVPFAYSSNGDAFLEHDRTVTSGTVTREIPLDQFPTPEELWARYCKAKGYTAHQETVATQDYYEYGSQKVPRYYQLIAINRTVDAIARGLTRILLVMATGTGKTYTAFQIIWRLWKSGARKRILFLVDRNILADQTKINDFKPFGQAMTKITNRTVDKSFEVYLCLYQAVTGTEEEQNIYKQFSPDFFDLVVVDECHRGSADEDAAWHKVLSYFSSATQIGLTATPKETKEISNIEYFGDPIYTYSLRQGISDGFLAPYKVVRIGLDKDLDGWRPEAGQRDKYGQLIADREYTITDYDKNLILEKRTALVAAKVTEFLKATDRFAKTIIFCDCVDHAERMRQAMVNANPDLAAANSKYVMRITGDNDEGKAQLDNFIDPESTYPVVCTTSRLMSTGVDAQTCHLIVLDRIINSPTEFKQIIGRGTRINEDYNKLFFTIMDFKRATVLFADPDFDGDPVQIYEPSGEQSVVPPDEEPGSEYPEPEAGGDVLHDGPEDSTAPKPTRYVVDDVEVTVATERVQYLDENGRLITESLKDYSRKTVRQTYASLDAFLSVWNDAERKQAVLEELAAKGVFLDELAEHVGRDYDAFDLVCHIAFDQPPLTRRERAERVKKRNVFAKYGGKARAVLDALLQKYADTGIKSVESLEILKVDPLADAPTPANLHFIFHRSYAIPPADLRKSILTLAVQGKLVPQDPNDEPAEEILAGIAGDVATAVRAKRMRNSRPIPACEDTSPFDLPFGWAWAPLGALTSAEDGAMCDGPFGSKLKTEHYIPTKGYAVLRLGNIGVGYFIHGKEGHISREHFESLPSNHTVPGDLLVAGLADPLVRCCEIPPDIGPAVNKSDCFRVRLSKRMERSYVRHYLNSPIAKAFAAEENHGMTRERINLANAKALPVSVPPLAEQRRIVAKVEQLMALVDALETQLAASRATAANLLSALVAELTSFSANGASPSQPGATSQVKGRKQNEG